jgi:hypothetical protein
VVYETGLPGAMSPIRRGPIAGAAGLLAEVAPSIRAILETVLRVPGDPAPGELGHGEVTPRVFDHPSRPILARVKKELVQEPVDGIDVICPPRCHSYSERCVADQLPGRPTGVQLRRDAAKQIVDLRHVIPPGPKPRVKNVVSRTSPPFTGGA